MNPSSSNLKILLVSDKFAPVIGGTAAVAEALASNLPASILVAATKVQPASSTVSDWPAYDRRFAFPVHRVPTFANDDLPLWIPTKLRAPLQFALNILWTRPRVIASLHKTLARTPVDVICINTLSCYWIAPILKRRYPNLKTVFYLHGEEVGGGLRKRKLDQYARIRLCQAEAVVVVSSFTRGLALECGVAPEKVTILHNGVDAARFTPGPRDATIEARFHLEGRQVILCLARLDQRKGQDNLIAAMPEILASFPNAVLLLVGGGEDGERLRQIAAQLNLGDKVIFAGVATNDELLAFYRTADIYAMPNRTMEDGDTEGFGLVFLEAGACAKPVIGGRAGGVPDAILEGETGFLVDGRSSTDIALACKRLLADPALATRLGQNGLAHSQQNTWAIQANKFLALCQHLF